MDLVEKFWQRLHLLSQVKKPKLVVSMGGVWALNLEGAISSFRFSVLLNAGMMERLGKIFLRAGESEIRWMCFLMSQG